MTQDDCISLIHAYAVVYIFVTPQGEYIEISNRNFITEDQAIKRLHGLVELQVKHLELERSGSLPEGR